MDLHSEISATENWLEQFKKDGVFVFKQLFAPEKIQIIANEVDAIREIVMTRIATMDRPLKTYSDIAERELGRLDYRCGFTSPVFNEIAEPIVSLVKHMSPEIDFRYYWGAIPSLGGSGPTPIHRDVYSMLNTVVDNNLNYLDINLPAYYFTVLIPLVQITKENGPTQFIKGSHKHSIVDENKAELYAPLLSPGDIVIFDGRTLHQGSANNTAQERVIAYITFVANWYHDQTFVINEYLFPELSTQGR